MEQEQRKIGISTSTISNYALKEAIPENADGKANPGETLYLDIGVKNSSPDDVRGIEVSLAGDNQNARQYVTIYEDRVVLGDLAAGREASLTGSGLNPKSRALMYPGRQDRAFRFSISDRCPAGSLVFTVRFRDSGGKEWTDTLTIPVVPNEGEMNLAIPARGEGGGLSRLFFSINPKLLEDGSMTDMSLGYDYNDTWTSELKVRFTKESWYEPLDESFDSSLNAVDDSSYEFFLFPAEYFFIKDLSVDLWAGLGAYYNYHPLKEEGYFNWSDLESVFGKPAVNAYSNDFSMNVIGPLVGGGISYRWDRVRVSASVGIVPVYFYWANQKMEIYPLLRSGHDYSQRKAGSPYLFGDLSVVLFNIVSFSGFYDFSYLDYNIVDFNYDEDTNEFFWYTSGSTVVSHTIKFEAALNIPLGGFSFQIGYGRYIVSTQANSQDPLWTNKQYLLINGQWRKVR
jgi:hypothetical protein